jgi:hypothetical protein
MIVAIGVDVDDTFVRFVQTALEAEIEPRCINLRVAVEGDWRFELPARTQARLRYAGEEIALSPEDAYFCRLIDLSAGLEPVVARRWRALMAGLRGFLDTAPGRVVNRPSSGLHNSSKPLHEATLRNLGLRVPESITSSDRDKLRAFVSEGPTISKAICGVRADAVMVTDDDLKGFDPESGPVHMQRCVPGDDARIHVVGRQVIAQRVGADSVDYRRAGAIGRMAVFDPPEPLRDRLIDATAALGLAFAGWDFKIDSSEDFWCLEANPMPGYGPYDAYCDGAISRAVQNYLSSEAS